MTYVDVTFLPCAKGHRTELPAVVQMGALLLVPGVLSEQGS